MKQKDRILTIREDIFQLSKLFETIANQNSPGITVKQLHLLETIANFPPNVLTISTLAGFAGSSRQNVKKMALILERGNLIKLSKDDQDGRVLRVEITEEGQNAINHRRGNNDDLFDQVFMDLDEKTIKLTAKTLSKMRKNCLRLTVKKKAAE